MLSEDLQKEIIHFENFFHKMGLKRIDGLIFGVLYLSPSPMTSEDIQQCTNLSQGAVSLGLKNLLQMNSIGLYDERMNNNLKYELRQEWKKMKRYSPKENALAIVASVFRKREEECIGELKSMGERVKKKLDSANLNHGSTHYSFQSFDSGNSGSMSKDVRISRLQSLLEACDMAQATIDFVKEISKNQNNEEIKNIQRLYPRMLKLIVENKNLFAGDFSLDKEKWQERARGIYFNLKNKFEQKEQGPKQ
jgi:DNA-binding transcriptional regulator GbsR (MarR family)